MKFEIKITKVLYTFLFILSFKKWNHKLSILLSVFLASCRSFTEGTMLWECCVRGGNIIINIKKQAFKEPLQHWNLCDLTSNFSILKKKMQQKSRRYFVRCSCQRRRLDSPVNSIWTKLFVYPFIYAKLISYCNISITSHCIISN